MKNIIKFLQSRRSITAKNMIDHNINEDDLDTILNCGIRVPDHGALNPWKLIVIKNNARLRIGNDILAKEFKINNPEATEEELDYERKRFCRANVIIAVLFKPVSHPKIPLWEMELSSGAVCTTLLIAAQSLGYAAQWLTEWYAYSKAIIIELGGNPDTDKVAGFIYIGNKEKDPIERRRPKKENVIDFLIE
ncbi:nitroreductase [Alphaproteobacteria bacterium]|jgi:nitroreductase|nr:nitroreductase [Alphaproteobacteria bacterium]MDB9872081.1 nitroreductase [Alphaproteobacteria bacterium]